MLAFITAQRTGRIGEYGLLQPVDRRVSLREGSSATVRRRLSIVCVEAGFACRSGVSLVAGNAPLFAMRGVARGPAAAGGTAAGGQLTDPRDAAIRADYPSL